MIWPGEKLFSNLSKTGSGWKFYVEFLQLSKSTVNNFSKIKSDIFTCYAFEKFENYSDVTMANLDKLL
jgi:hypothetical protein